LSDPSGTTDATKGDTTPKGTVDPKADPKATDSRITSEDKVYLDKLINVQKQQEAKELETAQELEKAKKLLESKETPDSDTNKRIKALEEQNKLLSDKRKADLLSFLDESDRKKYKEKSVEQLEILVEWLQDNPEKKQGMSRRPKSTTATNDKTQLSAGSVGTYNPKTGKWE